MNINKFSLEGKIAWITGGSYGIGFAIAEAYADCGATIVFNDINEDLVNKGLAAFEEKGMRNNLTPVRKTSLDKMGRIFHPLDCTGVP